MSTPSDRFKNSSVFDRLSAKIASNASVTQAQCIPLDLIDEDPKQPRRAFTQTQLEKMAASIRRRGVLQPIGVAVMGNGRYLLRIGGRRVRAARLAGLTEIPAVLSPHVELEDQVIENQHRLPNTDSELAAAVASLTEQGMKNADIANALNLDDPQSLKHYRSLTRMHETAPELSAWIDKVPVRALYELAAAWQKAEPEQRAELLDGLETAGEMTVTGARRLVNSVMAPPVSEVAQVVESTLEPEPAPPAPASVAAPAVKRKAKVAPDVDAERLAIVRAWIDNPARPRPPLNV